MFETTGAIKVVEPSALLLLVVIPALWSLAVATAGGRRSLAVRIALAGAAGNLAYAGVLAWRLASIARGHALGEHVAQLSRIGQLDLALDLVIDPLAAVFALLVTSIAFSAVLHDVWSATDERRLAWIGLFTASALLVVAGDGLAPIVTGLGLVSVSAYALARGTRIASVAVAASADACAVFALLVSFWALGGSFGKNGYEPDPLPRFVLVATDAAPGAKATLTMASHPGALVSADDGPPLPGEPLRAPFTVAVDPALYTFRIQTGAASSDVVVPHVAVAAGRSYALVPYGPTTSLRALFDQIAVPRPTPSGVLLDGRTLLASRSVGGVRATFVLALLFACAFVGRAFALAARRGRSSMAVAIEAVVPVYLALRIAPLLDPRAADGAVLMVLGATAAVLLAGRAVASVEPSRTIRCVLAAEASIAIAAAGAGDLPGGVAIAVPAALAGASALAAVARRRDVRWLGVACAAAVGLIPAAGVSSGLAAILARAITPGATWRSAGVVAGAGVVLAVALSALALFRMYYAYVARRGPARATRGQGAVVVVVAAAALGSGVVLGASTSPFGGRVAPLAARVLGVPFAPARMSAALALALGVFAAIVGVFLAGLTSRADAPSLSFAGAPMRAASSLAAMLGRVAGFLARGVVALDRDVIDDVPEALGRAAVSVGRGLVRAERSLDGRAGSGFSAAFVDAATVRLHLDDPRIATKAAAVIVAGLLAVLAAVVLSSLLLA